MRTRRHVFFFLAVLGLTLNTAEAQEYFGKNKVSLGDFDWHYIETEHFTIYFDKNSLPVASSPRKRLNVPWSRSRRP